MTRKVFIVEHPDSGHGQVGLMFQRRGWILTKNIEDADLIQFCGGSDVSPKLYGQHPYASTYYDETRDEVEEAIYTTAKEQGIPCAGICRGGQFLHVMNGGTMWQDVDGHMTSHQAVMYGKALPIRVSSDHHQMMNIPNSIRDKVLVLMSSNVSKEKHAMSELDHTKPYVLTRYAAVGAPDDDLEALYYPETNCLCFQPHPEYLNFKDCEDAYFHLLENYVFDEDNEERNWQDSEVCSICQRIPDYCSCE